MKTDNKTMDNKIFWDRVSSILDSRGISREKLSTDTEIPLNTLLGWISKKRLPDAELVCKIAKVLNTTVEYLVTGQEPVIKDYSADVIKAIDEALKPYR